MPKVFIAILIFVPVNRIECLLKVDEQHVHCSLLFCRLLNKDLKIIYLIDDRLAFSKTCLLSTEFPVHWVPHKRFIQENIFVQR